MMEEFTSKNRRMIAELLRGMQSQRTQAGTVSSGPVSASNMPGGTFYDFDPPALGTFDFYAVLVNAGPNSEADYSDARYWIREVMVVQATGATATGLPTLRIATKGIWAVATNLPEVADRTHSLPVYDGGMDADLTGPTVTVVRVTMVDGVATGLPAFPLNLNAVTPGNMLYTFASPNATGFFPVRVKQNGGADGTSSSYASWTYDLYALKDEDMATKLNKSGPVQPERSAARVTYGTVTQAANGSVGMAYRGVTGIVKLWDLVELCPVKVCE